MTTTNPYEVTSAEAALREWKRGEGRRIAEQARALRRAENLRDGITYPRIVTLRFDA